MDNKFDSTADTLRHIKRVNQLLGEAANELIRRGIRHDDSKLLSPEKEMFDEATQRLRGLTYGSEEYKKELVHLKPALDHHYAHNSHHPEHYKSGVNDMDLFDLMEMFFDWKAATERHADGNIFKSIELNRTRFKLSDQICDIFRNTAIRHSEICLCEESEILMDHSGGTPRCRYCGKTMRPSGTPSPLVPINRPSAEVAIKSKVVDEIIEKVEQLKGLAGKMAMGAWSEQMLELLRKYKEDNGLPSASLFELIKALEEYQKILASELNDVVGMAAVHGWKSSRVKEGEDARKKISELKSSLEL